MADLDVYMNGYKVGIFSCAKTGAHAFQYADSWLNQIGSRPISLSMPLRRQPYRGDEAYNFFDNLLPDNPEIRGRILARYHADSTQPFDLLARVGADSVGALQLLPNGAALGDIRTIDYKTLSCQELTKILTGYKTGAPLGMIEDIEDFRISLAGAQEKPHYCSKMVAGASPKAPRLQPISSSCLLAR